ncbi:MAG: ParB/RepB/Spo0J family partition protein [Oscillospiraceae bacterium]|nr:ParB/RepB/Spo0J family partition protein [Oscillospiraceae bacterium]
MSFKRRMGLGKGLDALFVDNNTETNQGSIKLNINDIEPNKSQPRKDFDEQELATLADSIRQYGIIQPILVRPMVSGLYQIIAGERRWRASRMVGESEIPCIVKEISDIETFEIGLIENLQREDLNIVEQALGYRELIDRFDLTQDEVSQKVGKSRPVVANALRLLNLPDEVLTLLKSGDISSGHARALLSFEDEDKILEIANNIILKDLTVRDLEKLSKSFKMQNSDQIIIKKENIERDVFFTEIELSLKEKLERNIKVRSKKGSEKGYLEIEFYDKDELQKIVKKLSLDDM